MFLSKWREFPSAPCLAGEKKSGWQLTSRCCWNRARPWYASELVSFLVRLRTYQHPVNAWVPAFPKVCYHRFISFFEWANERPQLNDYPSVISGDNYKGTSYSHIYIYIYIYIISSRCTSCHDRIVLQVVNVLCDTSITANLNFFLESRN